MDKSRFSNNMRPLAILIVVFVTAAVIYMSGKNNGKNQYFEADSGHHLIMGTFNRVVVLAKSKDISEKCIKAALEEMQNVDKKMSYHRQDSELSILNKSAFENAVKVSEELFDLLVTSIEYGKKTDGAFDVTVGPLMDLWKKAGESNSIPSETEIQQAKSKVGYENIILNANLHTVKFKIEGVKIDLGGIAKGFAVDRAVEAMKKNGAVGGMVDSGGNIRCFGIAPKGRDKWLVGLQDPNIDSEEIDSSKTLMTLGLKDYSVSTSGDYRRSIAVENKKVNHIMDRKTGSGSKNFSSVTIISPTATGADALSTAVSVLGFDKGMRLIKFEPNVEAIFVSPSPDFKIIFSDGAAKFVEDINSICRERVMKNDFERKTYIVKKAQSTFPLKGEWGVGFWKDIQSIDVDNYMGNEPAFKPKTKAKVAYDDKFIYVIFRVEDNFVRAVAKNVQDMVCRDSCVEFFFTPGEDLSKGYFNLEVNCGGVMLFNFQKARNVDKVPISPSDCNQIEIYHSMPKNVEPEIKQNTVWIVEYKLPLEILQKYTSQFAKPASNIKWRANFFKCGDDTSNPHWLTWSKVDYPQPNFHLPEFFGTLEFK